MKGIEIRRVIMVTSTTGKGTDENPVRYVYTVVDEATMTVLFTVDTWDEEDATGGPVVTFEKQLQVFRHAD